MAAGVLVNVESARELAVLERASQRLSLPARVALRVNPDFELKGSGMKMGGGPKQFGVDVECVPAVLAEMRERGLQFEGFHLFAGSQNLKPDSICEAQQKSYALALRLAEACPTPIRFLNLGGGFGIPYFPGEQRLDLAPIAANLADLSERAARELPQAELVIELGRYLVGEAGVYVTRVVDKKVSRGHTYLVCDGGLNHHLSASGNFGQVLRKNYPATIGNRQGGASETVSAVGPLCTPLDLLADKMALPAAEIDDLVVIFQSGAYGASASPARFLGHPEVTEVILSPQTGRSMATPPSNWIDRLLQRWVCAFCPSPAGLALAEHLLLAHYQITVLDVGARGQYRDFLRQEAGYSAGAFLRALGARWPAALPRRCTPWGHALH